MPSLIQNNREKVFDVLQKESVNARNRADRFSGIKEKLTGLGESFGLISRPSQSFSELPFSEKSKVLPKRDPLAGKGSKIPVKVPGMGSVDTIDRNAQDVSKVPALGEAAQTTQRDSSKSPKTQITQLPSRPDRTLNPKIVKTVIRDAKREVRAISGDNMASKLNNIDTSNVKSWGDLFLRMRRVVDYDPKTLTAIRNHVQSRWSLYLNDPRQTTQEHGTEFVPSVPQALSFQSLARKAFSPRQDKDFSTTPKTGTKISGAGMTKEMKDAVRTFLKIQKDVEKGKPEGIEISELAPRLPNIVPKETRKFIY